MIDVACRVHVSEPGSPGLRHGPETPRFLAGRLIEGGQEAADALVAARDPRHHQVADDQRRGRRAVVQPPVRHRRVPQQRAGEAVERDEMRVVGDHEDAIAGHGNAAVDAARGVAGEPLRARPRDSARC